MADSKTESKKQSKKTPEAPEGFDVPLGRSEHEGWVAKVPGNVVHGVLLGRYDYKAKGKDRTYYQVKLLAECLCTELDGEKDENGDWPDPTSFPVGTVVNLAEVFALTDLRRAADMVDRGGEVDIWFVFKGKEPNKNSEGEHWVLIPPRMKVRKQPTMAKAPPRLKADGTAPADAADIPF